jgi:hypothetical protein
MLHGQFPTKFGMRPSKVKSTGFGAFLIYYITLYNDESQSEAKAQNDKKILTDNLTAVVLENCYYHSQMQND